MPELPEVEVVKRSLKTFISNCTIRNVEINETSLRYKVKKKENSKLFTWYHLILHILFVHWVQLRNQYNYRHQW